MPRSVPVLRAFDHGQLNRIRSALPELYLIAARCGRRLIMYKGLVNNVYRTGNCIFFERYSEIFENKLNYFGKLYGGLSAAFGYACRFSRLMIKQRLLGRKSIRKEIIYKHSALLLKSYEKLRRKIFYFLMPQVLLRLRCEP